MRSIDPEQNHIHAKLMKLCPDVPKWWYWAILVFFFLMAVIVTERWRTDLEKMWDQSRHSVQE